MMNSLRQNFFFILITFFIFVSLEAQEVRKLEKHEEDISLNEFLQVPHSPPVNQDSTLVCWSFATTSFLESEMLRLHGMRIKLSVFYFVYYRFLEKIETVLFSEVTRSFSPGDLFMGVLDVVGNHGIVPLHAYEGEKKSTRYTHIALYAKLDSLVRSAQKLSQHERFQKMNDVRMLLDHFLGSPPQSFEFEGKTYTPFSFRDSVVRLPWREYITLTSFRYAPYYTFIELKVPDNWKHSHHFFNVPLTLFTQSLSETLKNGVTAVIDADITEPSYERKEPWCIINSTIPLSVEMREQMFEKGETTDDHLMHIVGYREKSGTEWFLAKDSWRTAWEGNEQGYKFLHSSYITYKVLSFLTHRDGIPSLHDFLRQH